MKTKSALWPLLVATPLLLTSCGGGTSGDAGADPENMVDAYALRIQQPILDAACVRCHGPGGSRSSSPLTGYEEVLAFVKPGNPTDSELVKWITTKSMAKYATAADRAAIAAWIAEGAPRWAPADSVEPPGPPGPARTVGMKACLVCHGTSLQFAGWLQGAHGNVQDLVGYAASPGTLDSTGFPYYGYRPPGTAADCYLACHDPLGDGQKLTAGLSGNVPRPVVGCESCHGGGANHYGQGPIPYARPDFTRCGLCHDKKFDHNQYHPEGDEILEKYVASPHASSVVNPAIFAAGTADVQALCSKCHTDEGARRYKNVTGGYTALAAALPTTLPPLAGATPVQCRTCHDPHDPLKLLMNATVAGSQVVQSAEFRTCTVCHQTADAIHGPASAYAWSKYAVGQGTYNSSRVFNDTHMDDPATDVIEGYILDPKSDRACRDCHDVHAANAAINRQWARSGHGGRLLAAKEKAAEIEGNPSPVFGAGVGKVDGPTTVAAPAWANYDWDHTFSKTAKDRADCQRCHTATGVKNFLTAQASSNDLDPANDVSYDPANNDFSHLDGWALRGTDGATVASKQNELLYCWGCHRDNAGGLRKPGALSLTFTNGASATYPEAAGSSVCLSCHTGRETGDSIQLDPADFANRSFLNSHYLAAGGTLYRQTGYEFYRGEGDHAAKYGNAPYFKHDLVGTSVAAGTGANGPCVGCHMRAAESHSFLPVARDGETGHIAGVASAACATCHDGTHGVALVAVGGDAAKVAAAADFLQGREEAFHAGLDALKGALAAQGYYFYEAHPYFYTGRYVQGYVEATADPHCASNLPVKNWNTGGTTLFTWNPTTKTCGSATLTVGAEDTGKRHMGAAFNYNLLKHDPGAYAHNSRYTKRLIFDSLDWLDNGVLDGTIDLRANLSAATYLDTDPTKDFDAAKVRRP